MRLIPETDYTNFYDIAKFRLTWNINLFLSIVLPVLAFFLFIFEQTTVWPTLIGAFFTSSILITLYLLKSYKVGSIIFALFGVTLCSFTLLNFQEEYHIVDLYWMLIVVLYVYFTLSKIWGHVILSISIISIIYFIQFKLNDNLLLVGTLDNEVLWALSINFIICSLIFAYLISQFLKTTKFAELKSLEMTSALKDKNYEVESQNIEKTVLLKEIHHRVKNNLQVITSLLRLQSNEIEDTKTLELFKDATNRVVAMSLIHDKMYQTEDLSNINLEEYLRTLLDEMILSYSIEMPIHSSIKSEIDTVKNESLVPLALIFNELVSNSLKHAFINKSVGKINMHIKRENGSIIMDYSDNGKWREKQKENSFGLELIESLTEQMEGEYKVSKNNGSTFMFILPDNL